MTDKVIFEIDPDALTWNDLDAMQEAQETGKIRSIRRILARFMVDAEGNLIPEDEAMKILGLLRISQIKNTVEAFTFELERQQNSAVPPDNSDDSSPPSATVVARPGGATSSRQRKSGASRRGKS